MRLNAMVSISALGSPLLVAAEAPSLSALYTSHGEMSPPTVEAGRYDYLVTLNEAVPSVALVPKINRSTAVPTVKPTTTTAASAANGTVSNNGLMDGWLNGEMFSRRGGADKSVSSAMPPIQVKVTWTGDDSTNGAWVEPEGSPLGVKKQIPLPENGSDMTVKIDLSDLETEERSIYSVTYKQLYEPPAGIYGLEASDNTGYRAIVDPTLSEDVQTYSVYVNPNATRVNLDIRCRGTTRNTSTVVNGKKYTGNSAQVNLARELEHHTQVVEVICGRYRKNGDDTPADKRYAIKVLSDYTIDQLDTLPTDIYMPAIKQQCQFNFDKKAYYCPDPQLPYHLVQLQSQNKPDIKYTMFNKARTSEVRLLDGQTSIPFTYSGDFSVRHEAGRFYQDYPLYFDGSMMRSLMSVLGSILAGLLLVLTAALLGIVGAASVFTLGFPLGATEIAGTLAFIIQYLCFSQNLKGSPRLTEFTEPLRWFTLFAPGPVQMSDNCSTASYSFGNGRIGDLRDPRNAQGALFWGLALLFGFVLCHLGLLFRFKVFEKGFTVPHHVQFGGWENRVLHALLFPLATACAYCLASDQICPIFKALAGAILGLYVLWIAAEALDVHAMVNAGKVVWIWNSSLKEDGQLEDESGYWADAMADQLLTQPVNRTRMRSLFPFTWVSPVADIVPQSVVSAQPDTVYGPHKYRAQNYQEASYGLGKTPHVVEVVRCRKPGGLCRGQRLVAGLLRTNWLDVLFTYESLTQFHANVTKNSGSSVVIPCVAKTSQLSGPFAGGRAMFFFDGARIPFIRIADCFYRLIVGMCLGISLVTPAHAVACFGAIAVLSVAMLGYTAATKPFTRINEGWLAVGTYATVAVSAVAFALYYVFNGDRDETTVLADLALWGIAVTCFVLGAYSLIIDSSIFSAVFCPPLDESKFLEQLSNTSIAITPTSDSRRSYRVETPGYSKYPTKDILMQATKTGNQRVHVSVTPSKQDPCLEFSEKQIKQACQTSQLPVPMVTLVARSRREPLGYKYLQVTKPDQFTHAVTDFLTNDDEHDAFEGTVARELARHVQYQTETRGRGGDTLLTVSVTPPTE
ncbi:putative transmembrane protein [Gregarina niphandrodes]|uniref:Transmembrane protein n=1 Tax=Gregarina niphandrodes TaxID=110365 RepID=A0A023B157_GRENI|nr:putative transmembrane protein [Gregarina niphandrodes]EZG45314.1 putative transmembrane protein [Gregarina niphandrodes]|eukprot:XP_011132529.1 putative transmembrane protein [Gregarina niphandrodes]